MLRFHPRHKQTLYRDNLLIPARLPLSRSTPRENPRFHKLPCVASRLSWSGYKAPILPDYDVHFRPLRAVRAFRITPCTARVTRA